MKYNKKQIMSDAWNLFRTFQKCATRLSFGECLRRAWAKAKESARLASAFAAGAVRCCVYVHDVILTAVEDACYILSGDTYKAKKYIKAAGFRWDAENRCWYTYDAETAFSFANTFGVA